jgi:RNA polymerase sigma factor for flagellar operon FliA
MRDADTPGNEQPSPAPAPELVLTIREHTLVRSALRVVKREAERVAKRFETIFKPEDLLAVGTIELYQAARDFNPEYNDVFADYAFRRVRCAMLKAVDEELYQDRVRRAVDIASDQFWAYLTDREYDAIRHDDNEARRRFRAIANGMLATAFMAGVEEAHRATLEAEIAERHEYESAIRALRAALQKLADNDHRLLVLLYRELKDMREAAKDLGISYATVKRRHTAAIDRLHVQLLAQGVERAPPPRAAEEGGTVLAFRPPEARNDPKVPGRS